MTITVVAEKSTLVHLCLIVTTAQGLDTGIVTDPGATCHGTTVAQNGPVTGHVSVIPDVKFGDGVAAQ